MDDIYRSQFRLPYALYERLKEAADRSGRSLNAELVYRLEQTFRDSSENGGVVDASVIANLADRLTHPSNRNELETLAAVICRLMDGHQKRKKK